MVEKAFIVKRGSDLYEEYFETALEKQRFHEHAKEFFLRNDLFSFGGKYLQSEDLIMSLTDEELAKYSSQVKKNPDKYGLYHFKKNSEINKLWKEKVSSNIDLNVIGQMRMWSLPYIRRGSYALWHDEMTLYGYLQDEDSDKLDLPDFFIPISMVEYLAAKDGGYGGGSDV